MLYLKRKIDAFLAEWKANPDRKPLIVKGPRQVGKTESIKRFGEMNYQSVITINFVEEPKYKMITADGYKADDITKYKIYFADSGLLVAMLDEEAQEDLRTNKNLGVYKGALYENVVGEALVKAGYKLYYYKRDDSTLEQDFFVRTASALIPVEVKAKNGTAKSMRTLISSEKYADIHCGIKFTGGNIGYSDNIYTFPYFCAFLLKRYLAGANI